MELTKLLLVITFVFWALAVLETVYLSFGPGLVFLFSLLFLQLPYGWFMVEIIHKIDRHT